MLPEDMPSEFTPDASCDLSIMIRQQFGKEKNAAVLEQLAINGCDFALFGV